MAEEATLDARERAELRQHLTQALARVEEPSFVRRLREARAIWKCYVVVKYAGFDVRKLADGATTFYANVVTGAVAWSVFHRYRITLTGFMALAALAGARFYWGERVIVKHGLLRHALFGQDDLAHELRLLLLFFNPESPYAQCYWQAVHARRQPTTSLTPV